jgi:cytochrome bd-type quinol oxidase subunit 1
MSLSFHIMFASLGVVVPFMLLVSQYLYLRRKNPVYLALNKKWTTAFAITYAIGAVSGVVLTFGLGLFWPRFMDFAGPMIGVPLSIEVMFFLLEAIFLGIYLFGRELLSPWVHWASLIPLFIGGFASMIVVILANSWMHTPVGFTLNEAGEVIDVDVLAAMFSPAWYAMTSHMSVAAFEAVGFAFAAVYAFGLLRGRRDEYHKKGFFLAALIPVFWIFYWRSRGVPTNRMLLSAIVLAGFLGFLAIELGWWTTEEGRQPWVAQGIMRVDEGFTLAPGIGTAFFGFAALYVFLSATLVWLLKRIASGAPPEEELEEDQEKQSEGAYAI